MQPRRKRSLLKTKKDNTNKTGLASLVTFALCIAIVILFSTSRQQQSHETYTTETEAQVESESYEMRARRLADRNKRPSIKATPITANGGKPSITTTSKPSPTPTVKSTVTGTPGATASKPSSPSVLGATPTSTPKINSQVVPTTPANTDLSSVNFAGYTWIPENSRNTMWGPGENYWSPNSNGIQVNANGSLTLNLWEKNGIWYCPEIGSTNNFGYGTYTFTLEPSATAIDNNIVFGAFIYDERNETNSAVEEWNKYHREIDMLEIARWNNAAYPNMNFTVHASSNTSNTENAYEVNTGLSSLTYTMVWQQNKIIFSGPPKAGQAQNYTWEYSGKVPSPAETKFRFNLWLFKGKSPASGKQQSITVKNFNYTPG